MKVGCWVNHSIALLIIIKYIFKNLPANFLVKFLVYSDI